MAIDTIQHLNTIRDRIGAVHARADQVNHLALTIKSHLVPHVEAGIGEESLAQPWLGSIDVLLGLLAELGEQLNAEAEAIGAVEVKLRCAAA